MSSPIIHFNQISAQYGAIKALHHVNIKIYEGEIVTLIGANGAGKSTLLMSLFGMPPIQSGSILFRGKEINHLKTHQLSKLGIAIAPEGRRIFPKMTTLENLELGAIHIKDKNRIKQNLEKIYHLFPILSTRQHQRCGTLSGGEQQMLAMGRALMAEPVLFLLDEPSLGLAPQIVEKIFTILKEIAQNGTTIFLVEQNARHALKLADRAYVLANGQVTLEGKGSELLKNESIQKAYLG